MKKIHLLSLAMLLLSFKGGHAFTIDKEVAAEIQECLRIQKICIYPQQQDLINEDIHVNHTITWDTDHTLTLVTKKSIFIEQNTFIENSSRGTLNLKAGMEPGDLDTYEGSVILHGSSPLRLSREGRVNIFYNPEERGVAHKYHNPHNYKQHSKFNNLNSYMLVNDIYDLQGISAFLSGNFALSQDINGTITTEWNGGSGFTPLGSASYPFSGTLEGNGYAISHLYIYRPSEDNIGLFGFSSGYFLERNKIANLVLKDFNIKGRDNVGGLIGLSTYTSLQNITLKGENFISGKLFIGGLVGSLWGQNNDFLAEAKSSANVNGQEKILSNGLTLKPGIVAGFCGGSSCSCHQFESTLKIGTCYSGKEISSLEELLEKIKGDNLTKENFLWEMYQLCNRGELLVLAPDSTLHCIQGSNVDYLSSLRKS